MNILRAKRTLASWLRVWSTRLDDVHLVIVAKGTNSATMAGYLSALAQKRGFESWTEYHAASKAKKAGRHIQARGR